MDCLDENTVTLFFEQRLDPDRAASVEQHIDGCAACRRVLSELARDRSELAGPTIVDDHPPAGDMLAAGDRVDRYTVHGLIGVGGMGAVYAAYDPVLDRKVALKLLRTGGGTRLLDEARAMARVSSENVVAVYDAGTFGDRVYVSMELVGGGTLRGWLRERSRSRREIVRVFEAIGRGLAAAHTEGIVHRDVKPENVLIDGDRVRVADFGLAVPVAGAIAGTPAYMAPEHLAGETTDARSDQFSYCVMFYEAMCGERPFAGTTLDELRAAIAGGRPPARGLPAGLHALVLRGLAVDPAARHASMDVLLAALVRRRRRTLYEIAAGGALAIAAVSATAAIAVTRGEGDPCATALPATPYDPLAIRVGFATAAPSGAATATRVLDRLERWRGDVAALRERACRAARVEHTESEELFDMRMACVARSADRIAALARELEHPSPALAVDAAIRVDGVAALDDCSAGRDSLARAAAPVPAHLRTQAAMLESRLAALEAVAARGQYELAADMAAQIAADAARDGLQRIEANAWAYAGRCRGQNEDNLAARDALRKAVVAADAAGDDRLRADLYLELASTSVDLDQSDDAQRWVDQARGLVDRLHDAQLRWRLAYAAGKSARDGKRGIAFLREAIDERHRLEPVEDHTAAVLIGALGAAQLGADDRDGLANLDHAIAIGERVLGPDHPGLINWLAARGAYMMQVGDNPGALPYLRRAYAIAEANPVRNQPQIAMTAAALGSLYGELGHYAESLAVIDRAVASYSAANGVTPTLAQLYLIRSEILSLLGRSEDAIADRLRVLAMRRKLEAADSPAIAEVLELLGRAQRKAHHVDDARRSYDEALAIRARHLDHPELRAAAELGLGSTLIDAGKPGDALPHIEHAIADATANTDPDSTDLAEAHTGLARALIALHRDRPRAIALLHQARAALKPGLDNAAELAEVDQLLASVGEH